MAVVQGGALTKETIPLPGGETAVYNANGLEFIRHTDWLGSSRLATTWAHAVYSKEAYAPFGETYNEAGTPDRSFTGQDQDTVTGSTGTGIYDFLFRKYDPSAGRWLSPDPAGWGVVDQGDPQSFNRYAYVENQPLSATDPEGLDCVWMSGGGVSVSFGDCPTTGAGANGTYIDCDGCAYNAASASYDPVTGDLIFNDANGNAIQGTLVVGFTDGTGVSTTVIVNGTTGEVDIGGYGIPGVMIYGSPGNFSGGSHPLSTAQTPQDLAKARVLKDYAAYKACTGDIDWGKVATGDGVGKIPYGSPPSSGGAPSSVDMGPIGPTDGPNVGSRNLNLALSKAGGCLAQNPYAVFDPRFNDIQASDAYPVEWP
jgi:RHS repeat-associated protein